uniref:Uncharacterized protein n=1 Tax=Leersia perrieri TaxID=77586 RepID=A0A0D9XI02_9ORYZ
MVITTSLGENFRVGPAENPVERKHREYDTSKLVLSMHRSSPLRTLDRRNRQVCRRRPLGKDVSTQETLPPPVPRRSTLIPPNSSSRRWPREEIDAASFRHRQAAAVQVVPCAAPAISGISKTSIDFARGVTASNCVSCVVTALRRAARARGRRGQRIAFIFCNLVLFPVGLP